MARYLNQELSEEEKFQKRLDRGTYTLDEDFFRGFKTSVRNGQVMLALEHLAEYLTDIQTELDALNAPQNSQQVDTTIPVPEKAKPAAAKKAVEGGES